MNIQLILLALLLIIGAYEIITLSIPTKSEKNLSLFWKKSINSLKVFERELRNNAIQKY
jgi:hypothetical protein